MQVVIVGGGPAGMMSAISAAEGGNAVILIEKNEKLGKKLFLTGKGRCNITNACPVEELFDNIMTNPKFLYSAFYDLDSTQTVCLFNSWGLKTKTERGKRVFPQSDHSSDVIKTLKLKMEKLGVRVMLGCEMTQILTKQLSDGNNKISGVIVKTQGHEQKIETDMLIMACGGRSYPLTGSDASFIRLLEPLGIRISPMEPSLVPLVCPDRLITNMQGLSLKNVGLTLYAGTKKRYSGFGEMLFTHFGISGPLVLSGSAHLRNEDYAKGIKACIDLKPALSPEELDGRIQRDFEENLNRKFSNSLGKLLPNKMITAVIKKTGIDPDKKVNTVTKQERQRLRDVIKCFETDVSGNRGFDEAIITRGGVNVHDINPSTMECKKIKGLKFAGEMIDTDALTGGFNLQIAWSTGYRAGRSIKEDNND